jgi:mannan endo-1,4-beta-mannosidase
MKGTQLFLVFFLFATTLNAQELPVDKDATKETKCLYRNLKKITEKGYLFGHQDDLAYGVNWKYEDGRSDVKDVTGDYPAVYGWEIGHLEIGAKINLDSVPFDKMREYIQAGYQRGGVITISWHGNNPMTGGSSWDPAPGTVESILPGGSKHKVFVDQLEKVASFLGSLKGKNGEMIPVAFRPFHEHTGGWFWWGAKTTTDEQYRQLFQFTVDYLKNKKQLHNLLYVYNTGSEFNDANSFLQRYPGDDVVDMLSFDTYQHNKKDPDTNFIKTTNKLLGVIEQVAKEKDKLVAFGETGYGQIPYSQWFTETLEKAIGDRKIAWVLLWRNAGFKAKENQTEFYVPYKGHSSAEDFIRFYNLPQTLFQGEVNYKMMYK